METITERIKGEIRWDHVARSRALRKIIERGIVKWLERQGLGLGAQSDPPRYRAFVGREGDGRLVNCQIEVVAGTRAWSGERIGQGLQQALADCLAHMNSTAFAIREARPVTA